MYKRLKKQNYRFSKQVMDEIDINYVHELITNYAKLHRSATFCNDIDIVCFK